jgi:hypothetical protein
MALKQPSKPIVVQTPKISDATVRRIARLQATDKMLEALEEPEG